MIEPLKTPCDLCDDTGVVYVGDERNIATWCYRPGCFERQALRRSQNDL